MSGKAALAKLRNRKKPPAPTPGEGGFDALEDMIIDDMADAMTRIGEMADDVSDWRTTTVQVVAQYEGVVAEIRTPKIPVVEMDGMVLFDFMYRSASNVAAEVVAYFVERSAGQDFTQTSVWTTWVGTYNTGNPSMDVVGRTMEILMEGQGWRLAKEKWRSPAWLFPPMSIPREAIVAHVQEEFDVKLLLTQEQSPDEDQLVAIAEDL